MSRKIARITQEKKLLLTNDVVEDNTKIRLNSDGRLDTDEIIEYPAELEGGRNLFSHPDIKGEEEYELPVYQGVGSFKQFYNCLTFDPSETVGEKYTISFWAKSPNGKTRLSIYNSNSNPKYFYIPPTTLTNNLSDEWQFFKITIINKEYEGSSTPSMDPRLWRRIEIYAPNQTGVLVKKIKVEKGDIATPWTPAPEDLGLNYPDSIQNFNSSTSGNNIIVPEFIEGYPFVKPVIDDSLVLWLDGSTGNNYEQTGIWKDLSGNGNHGQLVNFGYTEGNGWSDGGLNFDGVDDYVRVPNVLNMDGDFTVEIWVESDVYNTARPLFNTNARVSSPWDAKGFFITNIYNPHYLYFSINDGINRYVIRDINNVSTFNNSHIVVKREGNMLYSFFNYARQNSLDISSYKSFKTDNDITIARGYKGKVKVVRIYNRALSNEEILQNYQAGQCSPLLAMRGDV